MGLLFYMTETYGARGLLVPSRCQLSVIDCVLVADYLVR